MASSSRSRTKRLAPRGQTDNVALLYKTEELRRKFNDEWVSRPLHPMRGINFDDLDEEIRRIFEFQRLVTMLSWGYVVYPEPTLLFYLHLERHDQANVKGIKTYIYGQELVFTKDDIINFCGSHKEGWTARRNDTLPRFLSKIEPEYRRSDPEVAMLLCGNPSIPLLSITQVKQLCPLAKMLLSFIRDNLIPKHGDKSALTGAHKIMLYCLLARVPIAFPYMLFEIMLDVKKHVGRAVPYGQLITRLLSWKGISLRDIPVLPGLKRHYDRPSFQEHRQPQQAQVGSEDEEEQDMDQDPPLPADDAEVIWRASMENRLEGLSNVVERQGFEMHEMGRLMKKLGRHFGISSSKRMNSILQIDPTSTARFIPQDGDEEDESPPPGGDMGVGDVTGDVGDADADMAAAWDIPPAI